MVLSGYWRSIPSNRSILPEVQSLLESPFAVSNFDGDCLGGYHGELELRVREEERPSYWATTFRSRRRDREPMTDADQQALESLVKEIHAKAIENGAWE